MIPSFRKSTSPSATRQQVQRMSCTGEDHYSAFLLHSTPQELLEISKQQQQQQKIDKYATVGHSKNGMSCSDTRRTSTSGMFMSGLGNTSSSRRRDSSAAFTSATQSSSMDFFTIDNSSSINCNDTNNGMISKYENDDLEELLRMAVTDGPIRALPPKPKQNQGGKATDQQQQQQKWGMCGSFRRSMKVAASKLLTPRRRTPPAACFDKCIHPVKQT